MADLEHGENTGVVVIVRQLDFRVGAETGIAYEARLADGDWRKYRPTDEWQRRKIGSSLGYDTNSCITFSGNNTIEAQLKYLSEKGLPPGHVEFLADFLDEQGNPNASDWFGANTNGTTVDGNDLASFWEGVRKSGLLPQKDGYAPNDFTTNLQWLDKAKLTQAMRDKAMRFLDFFEVKYEWVVLEQPGRWDLFAKHAKQAPLHIAVGTGDGWNRKDGKPIQPVDSLRLNHAIAYWHQSQDLQHDILDHYDPFLKELAWPYYIPYAIKGVVSVKPAPGMPTPFKYRFNVNLRSGAAASQEVRKLQEALQYLGYMTKGVFGPYGPATTFALGKFQALNKIKDPDGAGMNFGPQTRAAMNKALGTS